MDLEALAQEEMGRAVARVTLARPVVKEAPEAEGDEPVEVEPYSDEVKQALIARREEALAFLAQDDPAARADAILDVLNDQMFDTEAAGQALLPSLMDLPNDALIGIKDQMPSMLESESSTLREIAIAVLLRTGEPLASLAERDAEAMVTAIAGFEPDQLPADTSTQMLDLVEAGTINAATGITQAVRLSSDLRSLFAKLAEKIDAARDLTFAEWGDPHRLAMAARQGMHAIPLADWPAGYEEYQIPEVSEDFVALGHEVYHREEVGCAKCHGHDGKGGDGFPPLAQSPWVVGEPLRAISIVMHGMSGEMELYPGGPVYNAQMEAVGTTFSDGEIAAALTYIRQNWGNFAAPVSPLDVKRVRNSEAMQPTHESGTWTADTLLAQFPYERDRILGSEKPTKELIPTWTPPTTGMIQMFIIVTAMMLAILLVTYYGGGRGGQSGSTGHAPAMA